MQGVAFVFPNGPAHGARPDIPGPDASGIFQGSCEIWSMDLWVDFEDASASAASTLRAGRMDGDQSPRARVLCKRLPDPVRLELVPPFTLRGNHAARYSHLTNTIIRRRGLPPQDDEWWIGHELAHRHLRRAERPFGDFEELWCNAFAAGILIPSEPLIERWRKGHDLRDLIEAFPLARPTCLALRVGELRLADTFIIQGAQARYTRAERAPSPDVVQLGAEAAQRGYVANTNARAWRLVDAPRRAAVVVDLAS